MALVTPYLGDPSVVADWKRKAARLENARIFAERHARAVERSAGYLSKHDLFVLFPKRTTSQEEKNTKPRNAEMYALCRRLCEEGKRKTLAVDDAAVMCGYGKARAWKIIGAREGKVGRAPHAPFHRTVCGMSLIRI